MEQNWETNECGRGDHMMTVEARRTLCNLLLDCIEFEASPQTVLKANRSQARLDNVAEALRTLDMVAFIKKLPKLDADQCTHGVVFDTALAATMTAEEVRAKFPRLDGHCPKGCGFIGIAYASMEHFVAGDW